MKQFIQVYSLDPEPRDFQIYTRGHLPIKNVRDHLAMLPTSTSKVETSAQGERGVWQGTFPGSLDTDSLAHGTLCTLGFLLDLSRPLFFPCPDSSSPPIQCESPPMFQTHACCYAGAVRSSCSQKTQSLPKGFIMVGSTFAPEMPLA